MTSHRALGPRYSVSPSSFGFIPRGTPPFVTRPSPAARRIPRARLSRERLHICLVPSHGRSSCAPYFKRHACPAARRLGSNTWHVNSSQPRGRAHVNASMHRLHAGRTTSHGHSSGVFCCQGINPFPVAWLHIAALLYVRVTIKAFFGCAPVRHQVAARFVACHF